MILPVVVFLFAGALIYSGLHDQSITDSLRSLLGRPPTGSLGSLSGLGKSNGSGGTGGVSAGTTGSLSGMVNAANAINSQNLPYVWGGGHVQAGTPSGGGYDCSGCTAAVLYGGGFWSGSVPNDSGIISELKSKGIIQGGEGTVTIYDMPGDHIFMSFLINGQRRYFGTSDGYNGPNNTAKFGKGGSGGTWLTWGPDVSTFFKYHIKEELLSDGTSGTATAPSHGGLF